MEEQVELRKKMAVFCVLDILQRYTDGEHPMKQSQIGELLRTEYRMEINRKALRKCIDDLIDFGYRIRSDAPCERTSVITPKGETGEKKTISSQVHTSGWYMERNITHAELRYLMDVLVSSRFLPQRQCQDLVDTLGELASVHFEKPVVPEWDTDNRQLFYTVEVLERAIQEGKQVEFCYCEYGTDKKLHRRRRPDGTERVYRINPYRLVMKDGKYYLICNNDKYDTVSNYRTDRILDIRLLDTPVKPFDSLEGADRRGLDLKQYLRQRLYMFNGEMISAKFRVSKTLISEIIDTFGKEVIFLAETETHVTVRVPRVSEEALHRFARMFLGDVVITEPESLAQKLRQDINLAAEQYGISGEG